MLRVRNFKKNKGLTQVELTIAMAISGVLLVAVAASMGNFSQSTKQISDRVNHNIDSRRAGHTLINIIEAAAVSVQFQHMPVKVGPSCATNQPCIRELIGGSTFQNVAGSSLGITPTPVTIEFFRDHDGGAMGGDVATAPAFDMTNPVIQQFTQPLKLPDNIFQNNYYATWPLIYTGDATQSQSPITFTRRAKSEDYFTLNPRFNTWDAGLANPPTYYFFYGSRTGIPTAPLVGTPMIVYDGSDAHHFTVQMIEAVIDCSVLIGGNSACLAQANAYGLKDPGDPLLPLDFTVNPYKAELLQQYAIVLSAMDTESSFAPFIPSTAVIGFSPSKWGRPGGAGIPQASGFYLFPTLGASIYGDTGDLLKPKLLSPPSNTTIDIRSFATFLDTMGTQSQVMAMPLWVTSYFLRYDSTLDRTSLVSRQYRRGANIEVTLVDDVKANVVFARRLGTHDISVFMYDQASGP